MYANFVSTWPSTMTSDHGVLLRGPLKASSSLSYGRLRRYSVHLSMHSFTFNPVQIMPTLSFASGESSFRALTVLFSAMWCSANTLLDILETSILRMNASSRSGRMYGDESDMPRDRFGMTDLLA